MKPFAPEGLCHHPNILFRFWGLHVYGTACMCSYRHQEVQVHASENGPEEQSCLVLGFHLHFRFQGNRQEQMANIALSAAARESGNGLPGVYVCPVHCHCACCSKRCCHIQTDIILPSQPDWPAGSWNSPSFLPVQCRKRWHQYLG